MTQILGAKPPFDLFEVDNILKNPFILSGPYFVHYLWEMLLAGLHQ